MTSFHNIAAAPYALGTGGGVLSQIFAGGRAGGYWDFSDLGTLYQDASETTPVAAADDPIGSVKSRWGSKVSLVSAAGGTARPLYKTSSGLHWAEFDGADDRLSGLFASTATFTRISAFRTISHTSGDRVFSGGAAQAGELYQSSTSPNLVMFSGINGTPITSISVGTDVVLTEIFNGASSSYSVNAATPTTVSVGTNNPGGVTIGAFYNGAVFSSFGNMRCYATLIAEGVLTDSQIAAVEGII